MAGVVGGVGGMRDADDEVQGKVEEVRAALIAALVTEGASCPADQELKALRYTTQVVAGTNYFVKIQAGTDILHARIFCGLGGEAARLASININVSEDSPIDHF